MCVNISSKFTKYNSQMRKNYCNKCFTETSKKNMILLIYLKKYTKNQLKLTVFWSLFIFIFIIGL